jgi:hypothetical protein
MGWGGKFLVVLSIAALSGCASDNVGQGPDQAAVSGDGSVAAAEQGEQLTKAGADALEKTLLTAPANLKAREELVGYYYIGQALVTTTPGKAPDLTAATIARDRHLLWLIQNSPGIELLGTTPMGLVEPAPDAAGYAAARDAWSHQAGDNAPAQVKGNAGIFFAQTDDPKAEGLLTAAEAADGQNPAWPAALADLYTAHARSSPLGSQAEQQAAQSAERELEKAWTLNGSSNRDPSLSTLAKLAVVAGEDAKAAQFATILLNTFKLGAGQGPLSVGGPIHDGNMVLGQVALHKGDRAGAEQYLLKAGATPGSPQMDVFGPNFSLARDLLVAGSKDVVLKYCDEVAKFWGDAKLAKWRKDIAAGQTPDFGDNLWT